MNFTSTPTSKVKHVKGREHKFVFCGTLFIISGAKLDRSAISAPMDMKHVAHIGWQERLHLFVMKLLHIICVNFSTDDGPQQPSVNDKNHLPKQIVTPCTILVIKSEQFYEQTHTHKLSPDVIPLNTSHTHLFIHVNHNRWTQEEHKDIHVDILHSQADTSCDLRNLHTICYNTHTHKNMIDLCNSFVHTTHIMHIIVYKFHYISLTNKHIFSTKTRSANSLLICR
jgi:hypothetical protein